MNGLIKLGTETLNQTLSMHGSTSNNNVRIIGEGLNWSETTINEQNLKELMLHPQEKQH